jgi:hypothetical protein
VDRISLRSLSVALAVVVVAAGSSASAVAAGTRWHVERYSGTSAGPFDSGAVSSTIVTSLRPKGRVAHLVVGVRLTTPSARSITLTLSGPGVTKSAILTSPPLAASSSFDGADFGSGSADCAGTPVVFDDASDRYFDQATPPFAGSFHPTGFIGPTAFLGSPAGGTWTLRAASPTQVTIDCWTLRIVREIAVPGKLFAVPNLLGSDVNTLFRKAVAAPSAKFRFRYDCRPLKYPITIQENRRSDIVTAQLPAPGKRVPAGTRLKLTFFSSDWHSSTKSSCFASGTPGG